MELVLLFALLILAGSTIFAIQCFLFFGLTERPVLLAVTLSWKLAIGAIVGLFVFGFGAILIPAIWINGAIAPLPNYSKVRDIVLALVISTISAVLMYIIGFSLAWETLG